MVRASWRASGRQVLPAYGGGQNRQPGAPVEAVTVGNKTQRGARMVTDAVPTSLDLARAAGS